MKRLIKKTPEINSYYQKISYVFLPTMFLVCFATVILKQINILENYIPTLIYGLATLIYLISLIKDVPYFALNSTFLIFSYIEILSIAYQVPESTFILFLFGLCLSTLFLNKYLVLAYSFLTSIVLFTLHFAFDFISTNVFSVEVSIFFFTTICFYVLTDNVQKLYLQIIENKNKEIKLIKKAEEDQMTGLLNKVSTENYIDLYFSYHHEKAAFFMLDLDDFKEINDTYGHKTGDLVIKEFSKILKKVFRDSDIIGRVGGDEFIVLMKNIELYKNAEKKANRILQELTKISTKLKIEKAVTVSIGISFSTKNGYNFHDLYEKADLALYQAKAKKKNKFIIYK